MSAAWGGKAETAIVAEQGTEGILHKGKLTLTPDKPSFAYLPQGADVIPHDELMRVMHDKPSLSFAENVKNNIELEKVVNALSGVKNAILNKKESHLHFDKNGFRTWVQNGNSWTEYINNYIRL